MLGGSQAHAFKHNAKRFVWKTRCWSDFLREEVLVSTRRLRLLWAKRTRDSKAKSCARDYYAAGQYEIQREMGALWSMP